MNKILFGIVVILLAIFSITSTSTQVAGWNHYQHKNSEKSVTVTESCNGSALVSIYAGDTRRTWRVEGVEKFVEKYQTEEFNATSISTLIEWNHNGTWKSADESYVTRNEASECPINVGGGNAPTFAGSTTNAPTCGAVAPVKIMANFHVIRNGVEAEIKWLPTEGNKAHVYFKEDFEAEWKHALRDVDNKGYAVIRDLDATRTYYFAGQQANDCAAGPLTNPVLTGVVNSLYR